MNIPGNKILRSILPFTMLTLLTFFMMTGTVRAQDVNSKITAAIKSSNATELAKYFNNSIDLTIHDSEGTYSKVQAEQIIKSFFVKYPPVSFTINHQGKSNDGSVYAIGTYKSKTLTFRTYYLAKPIGGQLLIHQLKFESREE